MIIHLQFGFHLPFRNFREHDCSISLRCSQPLQPIAKSVATMTWLTVTEYLSQMIMDMQSQSGTFLIHVLSPSLLQG
jgi:hypothetical protein